MHTHLIRTVASGLVFGIVAGCQSGTPSATLEGKVKRETTSIAPKYAGRIVQIHVAESNRVNQGDTLATLSIPEVEAKIQQAEGAVFSATAQYEMALHGATHEQKKQIQAAFQAATDQLEFAQTSLTRLKNMYADSLIAPQAFDEATNRYNMAMAHYQSALARKQEADGGLRQEQVRMTLGQKTQAEGALREAQTIWSERILIAPEQMRIETIALKEGELALPGYAIFVGCVPQSTWFRVTVPESRMNAFKLGGKYNVSQAFDRSTTLVATLVAIGELTKYGNRSSAYPNYSLGEAVYELKLVPDDREKASDWLQNSTVLIDVPAAKNELP